MNNIKQIFKFGFLFLFFSFYLRELKAGVVPSVNTIEETTYNERSNLVYRVKRKIIKQLTNSKNKILTLFHFFTKRYKLENTFGKIIAVIFFFIPCFIAYIVSFIMMLSTLKAINGVDKTYLVGALIAIISGFWAMMGSLVAGKTWRKALGTFLALPAIIILIIACIQLFSIIFGASGANFVFGLLSICVAAIVILYAKILGF